MPITAQDIAALRAQTGCGMMDCKKALDEAAGDMEKAVDILRTKGIAKAAKRADKIASEGLVVSYIHAGGKVGVLVEVNCETDFVAKTDGFKALANDIALHIAGISPKYVSRDEVPAGEIDREKAIYREQLIAEGKPEAMLEKIMAGKFDRYYSEVCLLEQAFLKDEEKTIEQLLTGKTAEIGEKITVRRFTRYALGEGIEKKVVDFAAEVNAEAGL